MPPLNLSMFSAAGIVLTAILSSAVLSPVVAVERYHLTIPVPSGGGIGGVSAINNRGWLAGISVTNQPYLVHAAIWRDGQMLNAGNLPGGGTQIFAINDSGLVVGSSHNGESGFHQGYLGGVGIAQQLSSLDGSYAQAVGINNLGVAVGWSIEQSPIFGERGRAVLWQGGAAVALPYLNPDSPSAWATDINDMGVVVGRSSNLACRWTGGVASLGTLGGDVSEALAINASGVIVGNSATCPSGGGGGPTSVLSSGGARDCIPYSRAFRYENGAMTELETPEGHDSSANDINDVGQIVGWTMDSESVRAALWVEGGLHWLDELHDGDPGVVLGRALKVNNRGEILCEGGILLTPKRTPVLILPGVAATYASESVDFTHWLFNRGVEPEAMIIDPLGHFYDDMLQTLDNAGYTPGVDLFAATYDWRVVPGPSDGVSDGVVNGISAASITDNSLVCGVDYLGHWLKQAMDAWETAHPGDTLKEVDLIAHSTGGLVARTYIQSAAYGGLLPDGRRLPRVRHLVMMGVPNRGASKPWNPLHDDWNGDLTFQVVLSKILNLAYQKVLGGWTLSGPDGPITATELQEAPEGPEQRFVRRYAPTIASLLGTYDFLDTGLGFQDVNGNSTWRNALVLDLNAGLDQVLNGDPNAFADSCQVSVIYGTNVSTPTTVRMRVGEEGGEGALCSFVEFASRDATAEDVWYDDIAPTVGGDGTVPLISSMEQFVGDTRVRLIPMTHGVNTNEEVSHCELMFNTQCQDTVLKILGTPVAQGQISTGLHSSWTTQASTLAEVAASILGGNVLSLVLDPVEGFVVDGQGRRLGWSAATGPLAEIPGSLWTGEGDGLGWHFGPLVEPVSLQLTGQGADHFAQLSLVTGWGQSGLSSSGPLAAGEPRNLALPFPPLSAPGVEIAWSAPGQALLSWSGVPGATSYQVQSAPTPDGPWSPLEVTTATSLTVAVGDDQTRLLRVVSLH